jgi:condensin complex subunit 2
MEGTSVRKPAEKKQKENFRIDFDEEVDFNKFFREGRASTHLKDSTLEKLDKIQTMIPEDIHYEVESFFKLYLRPLYAMIMEKTSNPAQVEDDDGEMYNYDNENDRQNFIPDYNQNDDDYGGGDDAGDDTFNDVTLSGASYIFSFRVLGSQPNKVRVLDINYAKQAKRIDVKKLKGAMWKILSTTNGGKENVDERVRPVPEVEKESSKMEGLYNFRSMYEELPNLVSKNMAKNLSCPIAFVCLLYLANEKTLKLEGTDTMDNIVISEGP